jgi:membrane-associated protease RseP (regulator of RpoE activity)
LARPIQLALSAGLFLLTTWTCASAGARLQRNFEADRPAIVLSPSLSALFLPSQDPREIISGLPFALTLLGILFVHEMGHFLTARHYRLNPTPPYFLPGPPVIGTFGAFIRIRSIVYSRKILFDVGAAGPIAGFLALIPALLVGLSKSKVVPGIAMQGDFVFATPLLLAGLESVFFPGVGGSDIYLHPVARAAWVGIFATALNLLPIGQLDGGHLVYALFGERHRMLTRLGLGALVPLGFLYPAWWFWGLLLFLLGRKHPFIFDAEPLGWRRKLVGAISGIIFLVSFMPAPILNG